VCASVDLALGAVEGVNQQSACSIPTTNLREQLACRSEVCLFYAIALQEEVACGGDDMSAHHPL
jgi:hypothetical protein